MFNIFLFNVMIKAGVLYERSSTMSEGLEIVFFIVLTVVGGAAAIIFFLCPFVGMIVMSNERTDASKKAVLESECHKYYPVVLKRTKKLLVVYLVSALCVVVPGILYMITKAWIPALIALIIGGGIVAFVGTRSFEPALEYIMVDMSGLTEMYKNGDKKVHILSEFKSYQTQGQNRLAHVDFVDSDGKKEEVYLGALSNANKQMVINDLLSLQSKGHF